MSSRIQFTASVARVLRSGLGRYLRLEDAPRDQGHPAVARGSHARDIGLHRSEIESTVHHMATALSRR